MGREAHAELTSGWLTKRPVTLYAGFTTDSPLPHLHRTRRLQSRLQDSTRLCALHGPCSSPCHHIAIAWPSLLSLQVVTPGDCEASPAPSIAHSLQPTIHSPLSFLVGPSVSVKEIRERRGQEHCSPSFALSLFPSVPFSILPLAQAHPTLVCDWPVLSIPLQI